MDDDNRPNPITAYFEDIRRLSASMINTYRRSPQLYYARYVGQTMPPSPSSAALDLGTACHLALLQPERFDDLVAVAPNVDRRTKVGKEVWAEFQAETEGLTILKMDQMEVVERVRSAVLASPRAVDLLESDGPVETPIQFVDGHTFVNCKALPDKVATERGIVVDLKTTTDSSPKGFAKSVANFGYAIQAAHYLEATELNRFVWIAVETVAPFAVHLYEMDPESLARARAMRLETIAEIQTAEANGEWGLRPTEIETLNLPAWVV
jgi:hypothetical protein